MQVKLSNHTLGLAVFCRSLAAPSGRCRVYFFRNGQHNLVPQTICVVYLGFGFARHSVTAWGPRCWVSLSALALLLCNPFVKGLLRAHGVRTGPNNFSLFVLAGNCQVVLAQVSVRLEVGLGGGR
jgi:hypothetical protein